jgi:UDP-N-acetylmuramoylalanine--D-glutamate ligase
MDASNLTGKRAVVMGLGRFGGGVGAARFLARAGADVLVTDATSADRLRDSVAALAGLPIEFRLGEHREGDFTIADVVVVNPAINPRTNRFVQAAREAGARVTSEVRLLVERLPNRRRVIGVTGTAGKSTVTGMIGHILAACMGRERVHVGGNIGGSLLESLQRIGPDDWVVLELSSFMLDGLGDDRWSPHVAVLTNITPNHLDWHGSWEAYRQAKQQVFEHQERDDCVVLNRKYESVFRYEVEPWRTQAVSFDPTPDDSCGGVKLLVPGEHNKLNAVTACGAARFAGVDRADASATVATFPGLPHRLQFVCEAAGVSFYNDSKATTPEATVLALGGFPPGRVHLIVGGYDKGSDLKPMTAHAAQTCRAIYTIGQTGDAIADVADAGDAQVVRCGTLDRAVAEAVTRARPGDIVLLSPACASWDQFDHFEQRGAAFVAAVLQHTGDPAPAPNA